VMRILVNGEEVAAGRIDRTIGAPLPDGETFDIGRDLGAPVSTAYTATGRFPGTLHQVNVELTN